MGSYTTTLPGTDPKKKAAGTIGNAINTIASGNTPDWLRKLSKPEMQTTTTKSSVPDWLQSAGQSNIARLNGMTGAGLTAQRNGTEHAGDAMTKANMGAWQPGMNRADSMVQQGAQGVDVERMTDADINAYMNPHMAAVMEQINRTGDQQRQRERVASMASGAFGGDRGQLALSAIDENTQRQSGLAAAQAFEAATDDWRADRDATVASAHQDKTRQLSAAAQQAQLAGLRSDMGFRDADQMRGVGERNRAVEQAAKDRELELAKARSQAIASTPHNKTTETTAPGPSRAGQELGMLVGLAGMGVTNLPGLQKEEEPKRRSIFDRQTGGFFGRRKTYGLRGTR